jgi:hypothetical protein
VGTEFDGLWHARADELVFEQVSTLPIRCLAWVDDGLYACVNSLLYGDGFIVGRSTDSGSTITPLLTLACVRPLECPDDSRAGFYCPAAFEELGPRIDADTCDGAGGAGGGGEGGGGASLEPEPPRASGGCAACVIQPTRDSQAMTFALWLAALAFVRRTGRWS